MRKNSSKPCPTCSNQISHFRYNQCIACYNANRRKRFWKTFWSKVKKTPTCWIWTGRKNNGGYGEAALNKKYYRTHRLVWELKNGPIPEGFHVLHHCDVRACCRKSHLWLGTARDNILDMISKGRDRIIGERSPMAKLSNEQVKEIIQSHKNGITDAETARKFKVGQPQIFRIVNGLRWRHLNV